MTERLAKAASGTRHGPWGREIRATIDAHIAHNDLLTDPQKAALRAESTTVAALLDALGGSDGAW